MTAFIIGLVLSLFLWWLIWKLRKPMTLKGYQFETRIDRTDYRKWVLENPEKLDQYVKEKNHE